MPEKLNFEESLQKLEEIAEKLEQGLAPSEAAKQAAAESGLAKRDIYRAILHDGGGADD